jgi:DNA-binding NarL/FixJ family response regulator
MFEDSADNTATARRAVTVVIAEDHDLMRRSLRRLLDQTPGVEVVAEAGDLALTAQHVAAHRPDVLVLDLTMPDGSSTELIGDLAGPLPRLRVIVIGGEDAPAFARSAGAAGASGYVWKERADSELAEAIMRAVEDEDFVGASAGRPTDARDR